jgi:alpha-tubulin suppressor-like RCC1 family protein
MLTETPPTSRTETYRSRRRVPCYRLRVRLACGAIAVVLSSCGGHSQYSCTASNQCVDQGMQGTCEPSGFCAFPDTSCPSGDRYEPNAGTGLGGQCVAPGTGIDSGIDGLPPNCGAVGMACCPDSSCGGNAYCASGTCAQCIVDMAIGNNHTCALKYDGTVWCSGDNGGGALGIGTFGGLPQAMRLQARDTTNTPIHDATAIASGNHHTCALRAGGAVWCWGNNDDGQVGDNTTNDRDVAHATQVVGGAALTAMAGLALADDQSCALDGSGGAWCWGFNGDGELGDGTVVSRSQAARVLVAAGGAPFTGIAEVTMGSRGQTCLRTASNQIWCWGANPDGQVGNNTTTAQSVPVQIVDGISVSAGRSQTCAVEPDGSVWCWGPPDKSRLGPGVGGDQLTPNAVLASAGGAQLGGATKVVAAALSCALVANGEVMCWGTNPHGQLGTGIGTATPMPVVYSNGTHLSNVTRMIANYAMACAFRSDGELLCWGRNEEGELGDGTFVSRNYPEPVKVSCP